MSRDAQGRGPKTTRCKLCDASPVVSKRSRLCLVCWERLNGPFFSADELLARIAADSEKRA